MANGIDLSIEIKEAGLDKVFRESGKVGTFEITIVAFDSVKEKYSMPVLIKFNPATSGVGGSISSLNAAASIPIEEDRIIDQLILYEREAGMSDDRLAVIDLENKEGEPEEIGDFSNNAGTYQINTFNIRF